MSGKKVLEQFSILRPTEKELFEWRSITNMPMVLMDYCWMLIGNFPFSLLSGFDISHI
jgi:hypothetical protein